MLDMDLPDLLRGRVDIIFSGHDHDYERGDADGIKYVVTGGGGAPLYTVNERLPFQLAFEPVHHYLRMRVEDGRLHMKAIRIDGSTIERCSFAKGEPWSCEDGTPTGPVVRGPSREEAVLRWLWRKWGFYIVAIPLVIAVAIYAWRRRRKKYPDDPESDRDED
jgi:hypothetical protein